MYSFAWSLFPVTFTLAAFTTTTGSPVSRCGEKLGLCLPRRRVATRVASRPSVAPSASTSFQCRSISALFVVYVFIALSLVVSLVRHCSAPRSPHLQLLIRLVFVDPSCAFPVFHRDEAQAVRRCARTGPRAVARRDDLAEPPGVDLPAAHPEEGPDDRADHPAEERVRRDLEPQQRTVRAPVRARDRPDAALARRERREVAPADQPRARFAHGRDVQRRRELELPQPLERQTLRRVPDPVFVCAARRGEPCVEVLLRRLELRDRDVLREKGVDPPPDRLSVQRARRPEVDDLPCRMHSRVGPPRAGDPDGFVADRGERALELRLHRRRVRLHLESGVARPVVGHARLPVRRIRSLLPSQSSWRPASSSRASQPSPRACAPCSWSLRGAGRGGGAASRRPRTRRPSLCPSPRRGRARGALAAPHRPRGGPGGRLAASPGGARGGGARGRGTTCRLWP